MSTPTADLDQLKNDLDEQHYLLQYAPFERLVVAPLVDDPQAVSFKLLFGYIRAKTTNDERSLSSAEFIDKDLVVISKQQIWIYLYPAAKPGSSVEIQFHSYTLDGRYVGREDGKNIGKTVSGFAAAFALPGRCKWSRSKIVALAKYYFLRKLVENGSKEDKEKFALGISTSKSFREDLKAVCRDFGEGVKRTTTLPTLAAVEIDQANSHKSELSNLPSVCLEETVAEPAANAVVKNELAALPEGATEVARNTASSHEGMAKEFIKLDQEEETISKDIYKIGQEIAVLEARCRAKEQEQKQVKKRKEELFQGMTLLDAFASGRDIERDHAEKRRKLD